MSSPASDVSVPAWLVSVTEKVSDKNVEVKTKELTAYLNSNGGVTRKPAVATSTASAHAPAKGSKVESGPEAEEVTAKIPEDLAADIAKPAVTKDANPKAEQLQQLPEIPIKINLPYISVPKTLGDEVVLRRFVTQEELETKRRRAAVNAAATIEIGKASSINASIEAFKKRKIEECGGSNDADASKKRTTAKGSGSGGSGGFNEDEMKALNIACKHLLR